MPADRDGVRHVACETGFMGGPVDPLFGDRDAFADFFTRYYTDWESENALVVEADGRVVGYVLGCLRARLYRVLQPLLLALGTAPRMAWRILRGGYRPGDFRFLGWFVVRAAAETPRAPPDAAHFHVNFLPEWRRAAPARALVFGFLDDLRRRGVSTVYGQIQTFDDRRPDKLFLRWGFRPYDRRRITRFERFRPEPVYVTTFVKDLRAIP